MTKGSRKSPTRTPRRRVIEIDDLKFSLLPIGKGRDITREEKIKIAEAVCSLYATDRFTLADCLRHCGVKSLSTWHKWTTEIEEIESLFEESQTSKDWHYRHHLKERARTVAEKLLEGYTVEVTEREGEAVTDKDGNLTDNFRILRIRKKELIVKPSVTLLQTILFNVDPDVFTQNPAPPQKGLNRPPTDIKIEIVGGDVDPITREEDIPDEI